MIPATGEAISTIEWSEAYSVDLPEVDEDHKVLLSLLNRCINITKQNTKNNELDAILDELLSYTQYHFEREEKIMEICEYPQLNKHKSTHRFFINVLAQHKMEYQRNELHAEKLLAFLRDWLNIHILGTDKVAASFCKDKKDLIQKALQ